jgi:integrase
MSTHPGIRKITTITGQAKYRLIVDMGKRPNGARHQHCQTFDTLKEAKAKQAQIRDGRETGTLIKPTKTTVGQAIDTWLAGRRNLRPATQRNYRHALELVSKRLGHVQLQALGKAQLDAMVTELLKSGRRSGNVKSQRLSPRSVNESLSLLSSVLEDAVRQGTLSRNVAKLVERPQQIRKEMRTWTADQAGAFLEHVAADRLSAAFQLSLYGLRRGEVLGLCWTDIDMAAKTLTIRRSRVEASSSMVVEGEPKTERGKRTLPLDDALVAARRLSRPSKPRNA